MARKKKSSDADTAKAIVAFLLVGSFLGWFEVARDFVADRLPLFIALGVALLTLLVLVVRRLLVTARANRARQRVLDAQVASTDGMTGKEFEQLVARLLQRDGYADVRIPGGSGDLGADVMATAPDGSVVVVQCKRYSEKARVSSPDMQKFLGTCFTEHDADHAWFVTTTRFSEPARDLGTRRGVTLVDRSALAEWMARGASVAPAATLVPRPDTVPGPA
ncbi:restriction endonuclease [Actinosynnema sp.]|uniref:restriction endonuclease n=1 Tax=Actinosynnema sp. TaxID=1872144 RepID=UPI003F878CB5